MARRDYWVGGGTREVGRRLERLGAKSLVKLIDSWDGGHGGEGICRVLSEGFKEYSRWIDGGGPVKALQRLGIHLLKNKFTFNILPGVFTLEPVRSGGRSGVVGHPVPAVGACVTYYRRKRPQTEPAMRSLLSSLKSLAIKTLESYVCLSTLEFISHWDMEKLEYSGLSLSPLIGD